MEMHAHMAQQRFGSNSKAEQNSLMWAESRAKNNHTSIYEGIW